MKIHNQDVLVQLLIVLAHARPQRSHYHIARVKHTRGSIAKERRHILVAVLATQLLQVDELLLHLSAFGLGALHGERLTAFDYSKNIRHFFTGLPFLDISDIALSLGRTLQSNCYYDRDRKIAFMVFY